MEWNFICSDGIDEIANAFKVNILDNDLNNLYQRFVHIDWNDLQMVFGNTESILNRWFCRLYIQKW